MNEKSPTLNNIVTCTRAVQGHTNCYANLDEKRLPRPYPKLKSFDFVYSVMDEKRGVSFLQSQAPNKCPKPKSSIQNLYMSNNYRIGQTHMYLRRGYEALKEYMGEGAK